MLATRRLPEQDLESVVVRTAGLWDLLRGENLFITGGTGFFGRWLLESFVHANTALGLNATAVVLTRDVAAFASKAPHLADHPAIHFVAGDVRTFNASEVNAQLGGAPRRFAAMIHAATESSTQGHAGDSLHMVDTVVGGTRTALEFARAAGVRRFLLTSSGAVYGRQPPELTHVPEDFMGGPDPVQPAASYAEGKRLAETLCACFHQQHPVLEPLIARCFAFVGPHLPLDAHFAIGNFIRDALRGDRIEIKGDGTPYRSYLYAADLAAWLWTILLKGAPCRPYNVGSEIGLPISDLAHVVAKTLGARGGVTIARQPVVGSLPERYVPSTLRARTELGLEEAVTLEEAVRRAAHFAAL